MKTFLKKILLSLVFLPSLSAALPLEFSAEYDIKKYGVALAISVYKLAHENNAVRMTQHTETTGFAALMSDDELDENSFLSVQNNKLLLTEFSYKQTSDDEKNRDTVLKIDWLLSENNLTGKVTGTSKGVKLELEVNQPVWDTASYLIPLMMNTSADAKPQQCAMFVKGELKSYTFITHGLEKIEVNGNTLQTIKVERNNDLGKNPIFLWLAPSLSNLPVKVDKWKNGKLQLSLVLRQAQFPSDKKMVFKSRGNSTDEFEDM